MEFCRYYSLSLSLSLIYVRVFMPSDLSLVPAMRHAPTGVGREEEARCNFQVKNRKKKRGEWTSGITEGREGGRREQINCSLAENTTASLLLQSSFVALTPLGMSASEGNTADAHFSCKVEQVML